MAIGGVAAILGGLILGAGHGLAQRELNQKRASEDFERQVMGRALLEAITSGNFTPEMRDSFKRFYGGKNSEAFAQIAEIMSSGIRQGQEEAIRRQAEFVREQMNRYRPEPPPESLGEPQALEPGAAPAPTAPLALPPILPQAAPPGVTPGASSGIGVAPPGRTFTIPVPTPPEGMGAVPAPMPSPPAGLATPGRQAPMPEAPPGLAVPGPLAPMPEGRVVQVPMQPAPAPPATAAAPPPIAQPAADIQQQYARQLRLLGGRQPGEPAPGSKASFSMVKGVSETIEARSTNDQGLDMLRATGRMPNLKVSTFLDAMASAGATLPEGRLEKWSAMQVQRTYEAQKADLAATGLRGQQLEQEAARRAVAFHGAPGGLPKELLYANKDSENADFLTFARSKVGSGWSPRAAYEGAIRLGFNPSHETLKGFQQEAFENDFAARTQKYAGTGPPDAIARRAVQEAYLATGFVPTDPARSKLLFPELPPLPAEVELELRKMGTTAGAASPTDLAVAQQRADVYQSGLRAGRAGSEEKARKIAELEVPTRAATSDIQKAAERGEEHRVAANLLATLKSNPDWAGGAFGAKGRIQSWLTNIDLAPQGFADFKSQIDKLSAIKLNRMAGAALSPEESRRYTKSIPALDQSTQQITANIRQTLIDIQELDARIARLQAGQSVLPTPGIERPSAPGGRPGTTAITPKLKKRRDGTWEFTD